MNFNHDVDHVFEFRRIKEELVYFCYSNLSKVELLNLNFYINSDLIQQKQNELKECISILRMGQRIPMSHFESIKNEITKLSLEESIIDTTQILKILDQIDIAQRIKTFFRSNDFPLLSAKLNAINTYSDIKKQISIYLTEKGLIRDTATSTLKKWRHEIRKMEFQLRSKTVSLAREKYNDQIVDNLAMFRNGRPVLAIRAGQVKQVKGIIHGYSGSGGTVYVEPNETIQLSSQLESLKAKEQREIDKILLKIANLLRPIVGNLDRNQKLLVEIDIIQSKANYALKIDASIPKINTKNQHITLIEMCHPILLQCNRREEIVPITIAMGNNDSRIILISGPNSGGKTVAIKTVALAVLLNQAIIALPCKEGSILPIFNKIFCDIGDQQSITDDLSTFTSHIYNIKEILEKSSLDTLVLIDELGTGTDPREGTALSKSILRKLLKLKCIVLATTHLSELKLFANETAGILNASMLFNKKILKSSFRLQIGIPGQSHAFYIAKQMGISEDLINCARKYLGSDHLNVESLIEELNNRISQNYLLEIQLDKKLVHTRSIEQKYEKKLKHIQLYERSMKEKAILDAEELLAGVNRDIEKSLEEIKESQAKKEVIKGAKSRITQTKTKINLAKKKLRDTINLGRTKFEIGDQVRHIKFQTIATITKIKQKKIFLEMGNLSLVVEDDQIELFTKREKKRQQVVKVNYSSINTNVKNEIDLRGLTVDEAWEKCDEYIDLALTTGWNMVHIIHGKGTGALRKFLNESLEHDQRVVSRKFATVGEGDTGVTVLKLRI